MKKTEVYLQDVEVNNSITTGGSLLAMTHLLGIVQYSSNDYYYWAVFESQNGELYRRKAIIDSRVTRSIKGPKITEDLYVCESSFKLSESESESIKDALMQHSSLNYVTEFDGEVNFDFTQTSGTPTIWVAKDEEFEHLCNLKKSHDECPLVYSLTIEPYKKKQHDISEFSDLLSHNRASNIEGTLHDFDESERNTDDYIQ